jgi:hypothetical protein
MAMCEFTVLGEWMTAGEITRAAASIVASRRRDSFISPKRESAEGEPGFSDCALKVENVTRTGRCIPLSSSREAARVSAPDIFLHTNPTF